MSDFYRYSRMRSRYGRRGGGGGAGAVLAAVLAVAFGVALARGGDGEVDEQTWRDKIADSQNAARSGQYELAWQRMNWKADQRMDRADGRCTPYASGEVRRFLDRTRCRSLRRALLSVVVDRGEKAVVSIVWVQMADGRTAGLLRGVAAASTDRGMVAPIGVNVLAMGDVQFAGQHRAVQRRGAWVIIAEATAGQGRPAGRVLDAAAEIAAQYPPPTRARPLAAPAGTG